MSVYCRASGHFILTDASLVLQVVQDPSRAKVDADKAKDASCSGTVSVFGLV